MPHDPHLHDCPIGLQVSPAAAKANIPDGQGRDAFKCTRCGNRRFVGEIAPASNPCTVSFRH
jgi:hypothetical protein